MIDLNEIIERVKISQKLSLNKEVAEMLGLSAADFSLRKKRGTLLTIIIEWGVNQNVNLDWLITGNKVAEHKKASNDNSSEPIDFKNAVIAEHYEIIKQFRDNERAKRFNQKLVKLESLSDGLFDKAESNVDQLIETAEIVVGEKTSKQQGRGAGKVERRKKA